MIKKYLLFVLSIVVAAITTAPSVQAQRSGSETIFPLLDQAQCSDASASSGYAKFESWDENISIGRQLHNSLYRMWTYASDSYFALLTCEINTAEFDTLSLQMGIADNAGINHDATVKIYQGGNILGEYRQLVSGDMVEYTIDLLNTSIGNPEDIAIELSCSNGGSSSYCYLYLINAELTPVNYVPVN